MIVELRMVPVIVLVLMLMLVGVLVSVLRGIIGVDKRGPGMVIGVLNIGIKLVIEIGSSVVGRPRRCGGRRVVPLQFCRKGMEQEEEEKGGGLRMIRRLRMEEEEEEEEEGGR
uniref:Uncharacterized protein n=1 Tax=Cucumis sativus TaxID=3659 RepID=A0A0A0LDH3_CUCSA